MKKYIITLLIIIWIIITTIFCYFKQNNKIISILENKIKSEEFNPIITKYEIFDENKNYLFVNSIWFSSNFCRTWRLFLVDFSNKDFSEIFSYKNTNESISPCIYNIEKLENNLFNMDFCLSDWWWSWECLGMNMIYDIHANKWTEWQLKWINIYDKNQVENPIESMDEYELEKYNYFLKWFN